MAFSDLSIGEQTRLTNLWAARDKLASGQMIAEVEYNGERRSYSKPNIGLLSDEIAKLERLAGMGGGTYGTVRIRL